MASDIEPGKQLTEKEKEALRADHAREAQESQQRAAEQAERDRQNGVKPVVHEVAESIGRQMKDKFGK